MYLLMLHAHIRAELNMTKLESTLADYHIGSILNCPFGLGPSGGKSGWTAKEWKEVR